MFITAQWNLQVGFVRALRIAFGTHDQFRYNADPQKSKIHIHDSFPLQGLRYPAIIVTVSGGPAMLRGIGDEIEEELTTEVTQDGACFDQVTSVVYGGQLAPSVTLDIRARSAYERAQIADWCIFYIRHFFTDRFTREGILIKDIQMGSQSQVLLGADPVYGTSLSVSCLTSWQRELPLATVHTLNALCLVGVFTSLPDGATFTESYL